MVRSKCCRVRPTAAQSANTVGDPIVDHRATVLWIPQEIGF
jgi:hypothetical protein